MAKRRPKKKSIKLAFEATTFRIPKIGAKRLKGGQTTRKSNVGIIGHPSRKSNVGIIRVKMKNKR